MALTLIENFRAVFYTPFYAAFALKAYEAEGLEVSPSKVLMFFGNVVPP